MLYIFLSCNSFIVTLIYTLAAEEIKFERCQLRISIAASKGINLLLRGFESEVENRLLIISTVIPLLLSSLHNKNNVPFHVCLRARAVGNF